ncbi:phage GP46 family protein [Janthinobacterium sp.]|uniref:phage GP46 family protein n=1 Tax=Janthinobacterium sp. TaxID=1871054 RepID=UPI00293D604F|nr:phage GP46 family protein [Janthinobacterium sp.]
MSDTSIIWDAANGRGDWVLNPSTMLAGAMQPGGLLLSGGDLETAVLISLFTDRIAAQDDVIPDGTGDPRGWWADDPLHPVGSRLWLLSRAKQTPETLSRAQDYIAEALQWLIDDGVVARFDILVEWTRSSQLGAQVVAYKKDGTTMSTSFQSAWKGIA